MYATGLPIQELRDMVRITDVGPEVFDLEREAKNALHYPVYEMVKPWPVDLDTQDVYQHIAVGGFNAMSRLDRDSQVAREVGDDENFRMRLMVPEQKELLKHRVFEPQRLGRLVMWELTELVPLPGSRKRVRRPLHPELNLLDITEGRLPYLKSA
jgi:hypothetical protein